MVTENILDLNDILRKENHHFCWATSVGDFALPGFEGKMRGLSANDLPALPAAIAGVMNNDSGFYEKVVTIEGETGLSIHVLYDYDWIKDIADANTFLNDIILNVFGAVLPALAVRLRDSIRNALRSDKNINWHIEFTMLTGFDTDPFGHEIVIFVPFDTADLDSAALFHQKEYTIRAIEKTLSEVAYNAEFFNSYINGLVQAVCGNVKMVEQ